MPFESRWFVVIIFSTDGTVFAFFQNTFIRRRPLLRVLFLFWYVIMYPYFMNSNIDAAVICLNYAQTCLNTVFNGYVSPLLIWVKSRRKSCWQLFMPKCSCKMLNISSFEIFTFLAISRTFTRRPSNKISWKTVDRFFSRDLNCTSRTLCICCVPTATTKFHKTLLNYTVDS